jgi:SAM-dependent methyltransferase
MRADHMMHSGWQQHTSTAAASVQAFYHTLPFNYASSPEEQAQAIRAHNQIAMYAPVDRILRTQRLSCVLDVGSGAGWFVNSVARWYETPAHGVDFCGRAVQRARDAAQALDLSTPVEFVEADIFELPDSIRARRFPLVNSLGVLHHTRDCRQACQIAASLVAPRGYFHLGLYHRHGRKPLMDLFEPVRQASARATSDDERREIELQGFDSWKRLHTATSSETFSWSWYRDQCLHPHETQWTVAEVVEWFRECGLTPIATSLNRFEEVTDWTAIARDEPIQEQRGRSHLAEGRFFPGFFTVLGQRQ